MNLISHVKIQFIIILKKSIYRWSFLLLLILSVLTGLIIIKYPNRSFLLSFFAYMKGYVNGFNFSGSLIYSIYGFIIFFTIIITSASVSSEYQNRTLHSLLVKKVKRKDIILSKSVGLFTFFLFTFLVIVILSLAWGVLTFDTGDITEKGYVIHSFFSLLTNYILTLFFMIFPLMAIVCLSIFFSVLFKNSLLAIILNLLLNFITYIMVELEIIKEFLLINYLYYPLDVFHRYAQGLSPKWSPGIWFMIIACVSYSVIFLLLSIKIFNKKELP